MSINKVDIKELDHIVEKMIETVGISKNEVYLIGEKSRSEYESIIAELNVVRQRVLQVIDEGDILEQKNRFARKRLSEVSRHFNNYNEVQVKDAYEKAHDLQVELQMNRQLEKELRNKRDDLERRLVNLHDTIERANHLVSQISIVFNFLTSDLISVGEMLQDAKRLQEFGFKIIEAQEEERKRLSREIHDGPAQMMANVMLRSDLIERIYREQGAKEAIMEIHNLKQMVRSALYEVRRIIYDLRPMYLDDLGLVKNIKKYCQTIEEYSKTITIEFVSLKEEICLPSKLEVAIFRLIQESIQNAIKHAEPTYIHVKIDVNRSNVITVIKDNGKGFDTEIQKEGSFGLIGMKERVQLLEGELSINSNIGSGTVILISIPIPMDISKK